MKVNEEIMEILEAFDLTQSNEAAARLSGCDLGRVSDYELERFLGHSRAETTRRYSHLFPSAQERARGT